MLKTYQYRIYPTTKQKLTLESNLEACRNLYNQALDQRKAAYEETGVGKIKTLTINRKASGWYANITVEVADVPKAEIQSLIGIDVGLESFLTTSDGEKVENPRHLRTSEMRCRSGGVRGAPRVLLLKRVQRLVSKHKKGSHRRRKMVDCLAKRHEHIGNQRKDFHFKTAHGLFSRYDAVVVEDLQIRNMVKNHHLAKSISDAARGNGVAATPLSAWGNFVLALGSKAENAGCHLLKVSPHGTSQECSGCGEMVKKSLAIRTHCCDACGLVLDRDHNAAINILRAATALRGGVLVVNSPDETRNSRSGGLQAPAFMRG